MGIHPTKTEPPPTRDGNPVERGSLPRQRRLVRPRQQLDPSHVFDFKKPRLSTSGVSFISQSMVYCHVQGATTQSFAEDDAVTI